MKHSKRDLANTALCLVKTGCQWWLLPNDFPPYPTVWSFYWRAVKSGKWEQVKKLLVEKTRVQAGRNPDPSYAVIDSQSAKTKSASENSRR